MSENMENPENRTASGMFTKGISGNPGGRPKSIENFRQLARDHSLEALETAIAIMRDGRAKNQDRLKSVEIILNRAYGLPTTMVAGGVNEDGSEKPFTIESIVSLLSK